MKRIISIITSTALVGAMSATAFAAGTFSDMDDTKYDWARENVEAMAKKGYITGYDDGTFKPDQNITKLECIALFARAMGSSDKANESFVAGARETFDDLLKGYYLSWGQDELAYMLKKGVLARSDLDTYIKDVKDEPMQRYEAAIIITKAMGAEEEVKKATGITLDYTDAKQVPASAIPYVNYVTEQGIMMGMDDNSFGPLSPVLRSQMATMLARVVDKTAYEYVTGKLTDIDLENKIITVRAESGQDAEYTIDDNTLFKIQGVVTKAESMIVNVNVNVTISKDVVTDVDATSSTPDEKITGRYQGSQLTSAGTVIKIRPNGSTGTEQYTCAEGMSVIYEGTPATLRSFKVDDLMTISVEDGKIVLIEGEQKTQKISNAKLDKINLDDELTMTITHADKDYDGKTYPVSNSVTVMKNGVPSDMSGLYTGDSVDLTLDYGEVTRVVATSATKSYQGTVNSISFADETTMSLKINGEIKEFVVPADASIMRNNEEATLYDFRIGDYVTVTTESGAITKITSSGETATDGKISGKVTVVNTSYGFIKILKEGSDVAETVYCKASNVTVITSKGASKNLSDVKVGDTVETRCTVSNGAYTAKVIIIEE